eukprot:TRINITY_DN5629_c0_g2_i8.p1 TRINITY_DN5629_c0_g2~~TRINITY_DN5629_c0_g2_i8.p1  ORF type:complete len:507 (+),score=176.70 TRINITY_DN5629_c0_g2_i8:76-1521(+)
MAAALHGEGPATPAQRLWVFYLLHAPEKVSQAAPLAAEHCGAEGQLYRSLEERYGTWRFFEVWDALDLFYQQRAPEKLPNVPRLIRDWAPNGLEGLLRSLDEKYNCSFFRDQGLIPLADAGSERAQVVALYRRYEPQRLGCVGALMRAYRGHEGELLRMLRVRFEPHGALHHRASSPPRQPPPPPAAPAPMRSSAEPAQHNSSASGSLPAPQGDAGSLLNPASVPAAPPSSTIASGQSAPPAPGACSAAAAAAAVEAAAAAAAVRLSAPPGTAHSGALHGALAGEWGAPDWHGLTSALRQKDELIAKQTQALQQMSGALAEQRERAARAHSMLPQLTEQTQQQQRSLDQLSCMVGELCAQHCDREHQQGERLRVAEAMLQDQQRQQSELQLALAAMHQSDLSCLASILGVDVAAGELQSRSESLAQGSTPHPPPAPTSQRHAQQAAPGMHFASSASPERSRSPRSECSRNQREPLPQGAGW